MQSFKIWWNTSFNCSFFCTVYTALFENSLPWVELWELMCLWNKNIKWKLFCAICFTVEKEMWNSLSFKHLHHSWRPDSNPFIISKVSHYICTTVVFVRNIRVRLGTCTFYYQTRILLAWGVQCWNTSLRSGWWTVIITITIVINGPWGLRHTLTMIKFNINFQMRSYIRTLFSPSMESQGKHWIWQISF